MPSGIDCRELLEQARQLASHGEDEAAKTVYLTVLSHDNTDFDALNELGALAFASDHVSAARTAYTHAVRCHPANPLARVNLGDLLHKIGDAVAARAQYEAALIIDADFPEAHQGLARVLTELGETALAAPHWHKGFAEHAIVAQRYCGSGTAIPLLLLVSAKGGNIPTQRILDDRIYAVSAIYTEFYETGQVLPPHALVFNAIGDADLCADALTKAEALLRQTTAPVINAPRFVRQTGRADNVRRVGEIPGVVAPSIRSVTRSTLAAERLSFPLLLRAPGFHTGQHFHRVERREDLAATIAEMPTDEMLVMQYLDARGPDGMARKYRVMIIDGSPYPLHLAISRDWKVHYFTADMVSSPAHRAEEKRFLDDMESVLGARAMTALARIARRLGLDYAGIDFGLSPDGSVLFFEANATMVIVPPPPDPIWDYKRKATERVLDAVHRMLLARATSDGKPPDGPARPRATAAFPRDTVPPHTGTADESGIPPAD